MLVPFLFSDLHFKDYVTMAEIPTDDPRVSGKPDDTIFARNELHEMLYFINYCYSLWNWPSYTKSNGRKVERLIRIYIPSGIRNQKAVLDWIKENWSHYWNHLLIR